LKKALKKKFSEKKKKKEKEKGKNIFLKEIFYREFL
jgi:hypothetical protein